MNPELSSWKKVVAQAEIIEIAENVAERRDRNLAKPRNHQLLDLVEDIKSPNTYRQMGLSER